MQSIEQPTVPASDTERIAARLRVLYARRRQLESEVTTDRRKWRSRLRALLAVYHEIEHHLVARALARYHSSSAANEHANKAVA